MWKARQGVALGFLLFDFGYSEVNFCVSMDMWRLQVQLKKHTLFSCLYWNPYKDYIGQDSTN